MFSWLPRQRARIEHIDAEAEALICYYGAGAYSEARRRELEASSDAIAEDWDRVALMVARKTEGRAVRQTRERQATDRPERQATRATRADPIDELKRMIGGEEMAPPCRCQRPSPGSE
jgi:hypothetical protein